MPDCCDDKAEGLACDMLDVLEGECRTAGMKAALLLMSGLVAESIEPQQLDAIVDHIASNIKSTVRLYWSENPAGVDAVGEGRMLQ